MIALLAALLVAADPPPNAPFVARTDGPLKCKVGAFIYGMSQFNVALGTVDVDMYTWIWCPPAEGMDPAAMRLALVGAANEQRDDTYETDMVGGKYRYERIRATLRVAQDLRKYPFDKQHLSIDLESSVLSSDIVAFEIDDDVALQKSPKCCIDDQVQLSEWVITEVKPSLEDHQYATRFGIRDPGVNARNYSRLSLDLVAERVVAPYLLKVLFPLFLILAVAYLTWWFKPDDLDAVTSLLVTCLLAAVALHLAQATALPNIGYLVVSDWFFLHSYAMLLIMLGLFTAGYRWANSDQADKAVKLQQWARLALPMLLALGWILPVALR